MLSLFFNYVIIRENIYVCLMQVHLVNDRHLRSHGKIGDCEQSKVHWTTCRTVTAESPLMDTIQYHVRPTGGSRVEHRSITILYIAVWLYEWRWFWKQLLVTDILTTQLFSEQPSSRRPHYTSHYQCKSATYWLSLPSRMQDACHLNLVQWH